MAEHIDTTRRGFLRMAPAVTIGIGLGVTVTKTLDEEIEDTIAALKELWIKRHGELKVAIADNDQKFILIATKLHS